MSKLIGTSWRVYYKNYQGVSNIRHITIKDFFIKSTMYHHNVQLIIKVYDHDRKADRDYAAVDIKDWVKDKCSE